MPSLFLMKYGIIIKNRAEQITSSKDRTIQFARKLHLIIWIIIEKLKATPEKSHHWLLRSDLKLQG